MVIPLSPRSPKKGELLLLGGFDLHSHQHVPRCGGLRQDAETVQAAQQPWLTLAPSKMVKYYGLTSLTTKNGETCRSLTGKQIE